MCNQNPIIERILELREQGEIVTRISRPRPNEMCQYHCTLSAPFEFRSECFFHARDTADSLKVWAEASFRLHGGFVGQQNQLATPIEVGIPAASEGLADDSLFAMHSGSSPWTSYREPKPRIFEMPSC